VSRLCIHFGAARIVSEMASTPAYYFLVCWLVCQVFVASLHFLFGTSHLLFDFQVGQVIWVGHFLKDLDV